MRTSKTRSIWELCYLGPFQLEPPASFPFRVYLSPLLSSVPQAPESLLHCQLLLWPGSGAPMRKVVLHKCSITVANFLFEDYKTLGAESHLGLFLETCSVLIACIID